MRVTVTILCAAALAGCATAGANYVPVVDLKQKDPHQYAVDLQECQGLAMQRANAASGAVAGAIFGALLGALVAPPGDRNYVASHAALIGAAGGAGQTNGTQEDIVKRCLAGRGYSVLN
jgi:outer membrane lipoprotein SlyB